MWRPATKAITGTNDGKCTVTSYYYMSFLFPFLPITWYLHTHCLLSTSWKPKALWAGSGRIIRTTPTCTTLTICLPSAATPAQ